jgi:hypothetical protein
VEKLMISLQNRMTDMNLREQYGALSDGKNVEPFEVVYKSIGF